jgi:L-2,4-diaminobutyric acid acetyltransferase
LKVLSEKTPDFKFTHQTNCHLREPDAGDGYRIHKLIESCAPLDTNSMYCNLLQCSHFAATSVLAERDGHLLGFISGYALPEAPDTLFVWQVAVAAEARGQGLASQMLMHVLQRSQHDFHYLHTSITDSNLASWNTFRRLSARLQAPLETRVMFDRRAHFGDEHNTETLVCIGPFNLPIPIASITQE